MCHARLLGVCFLVLGTAAGAAAQTPPVASDVVLFVEPLTADRTHELDRWLDELEKWKRFETKHRNRPARDSIGRIVARPSRPEPPEWLNGYCASARAAGVVDLEQRTAGACRLAADPWEAADPAWLQAQAAREDAEKPDKYSSFFTRFHLDGLGVTMSSGARAYGLLGTHMTLVDVGRVQVFGPPGIMLLSIPEPGGDRRLTLGYTWGLSVRLADVRLLSARKLTLFVTVSKVWVNSGNRQLDTGGLQIVSLSLAPRKRK
jgi:hypothetical protein